MDWHKYLFVERQVERRSNPMGLPDMQMADAPVIEAAIAELEADLNGFSLEPSYLQFARSVGPGTVGRIRIFAFSDSIASPADIRRWSAQFRQKYRSDWKPAHSFDMSRLVVFAHDVRESIFFAWLAGDGSAQSSVTAVYAFEDKERARPPRRVAADFVEFVAECALGTRLDELGVRRLRDADSNDESSDDSDKDDESGSGGAREAPPAIFQPFPAAPTR